MLSPRATPPKRHRRNRFGGSDPETVRHALQQVKECDKERERHAKLLASGAPAALDVLNGVWQRSEAAPELGDHPHYIKDASRGDTACTLHLFNQFGTWQITRSDPASILAGSDVLARSLSDGQHPNTVDKGSWSLLASTSGLVPCDAFDFWTDGPNTPEQPFLMEELGLDYFIRAQPRKQVIWFEDPSTGQVFHSGAKKAGTHSDKPGNRYCPMCERCFSANNFKSQHMRSHLRLNARDRCESLPATPLHSPLPSPTSKFDEPTGFGDEPTGVTELVIDEELAIAFEAAVMMPIPLNAPAVAKIKSFDPIETLLDDF